MWRVVVRRPPLGLPLRSRQVRPRVSYHFPIELESHPRLKARQIDPYPVMEYHMKRLLTMCAAVGASLLATSFALAVEPALTPPDPSLPGEQTIHRGSINSYFAD